MNGAMPAAKKFCVKLRLPPWCREKTLIPWPTASPGADGYTELRREWRAGDSLELRLKLEPRVVAGDHLNQGKAAVLYGPLVLAIDEALLADSGPPFNSCALLRAEQVEELEHQHDDDGTRERHGNLRTGWV